MTTPEAVPHLRRLGHTDIEITPIGLGVMQFAGGRGLFRLMFPAIPAATTDAIVRAALDGGINWFDTAEMYGRGHSEAALANGLRAAGIADGDVVVATKWWPLLRTAGSIRGTVAERQRHLAGYGIDLHQVHQPFSFASPEAEMDAMADLIEAGTIRAAGVSNFSAKQMRRAFDALAKRGFALASNQVQYSLIERGIEYNGVLDAAKELGITIIAWSPLGSGLLTGRYHRDPDALRRVPVGRRLALRRSMERSRPLVAALEEIGAAHDATPAQVALNWLIHAHGDTVVAIPGASAVHHATEGAAAMGFRLSDAEMERLDTLSRELR